MATTFVDYTGDGNATKSFSFPSIKEADIKVEVDEVIKTSGNHYNITSYTTTGGGNVVFTSGNIPSSPAQIRIFRDTDVDSAKATFTAGSSVKAGDLNNNNKQLLYSAQEEQNQTIQTSKIKDSAVTTAKIKDLNVTTAKIANDAVTADKLPDDVINSEHYAAVSIDTEHIANENVTTAKLANLAVTTSKLADANVTTAKIAPDNITNALIADNQIDSEHYVDGSIDRVHLEADIIDGTKLADNAVDSEHYTDGSIDRVHLEADIIDSTKLADNAVNSEHYVDGSIDHVHLANDIIDGDNIQDDVINSEHYVAGSIDHEHLANDIIDGDNIQDDVVNSEHIAAGALDNEHYAAGSITSDKLNDATVITSSEQGSATTNDTSFLTSAAADARFFNISTGDTIKDGDTFPDNDTTIATTAAINDRIIDLVDDVGGFVPIANETSFPTANPDVNNGAGTLVSIKAIGSTRTPSTGTVTIANGSGSNTVSITGCGSTVLTAGFGVIVETTSTLHTYAFHRLVPKATEVSTVAANATNIAAAGANTANINSVVANASNVNTVAGNISNVNTVGGISANVTTVAGISSNVTTVANNNANVTAVAGNNSNITDVADNETNINAVKNNETNINTVAGNNSNITAVAGNASNINAAVSNASNINSAVSNASNINSAVSNASNINTVAGSISNVNTTAGSITNVNTVASNISNVNSFAGTYQIASSAPSTDGSGNALAEGDLYFDTSSNELRIYNGSSWQGGVTAGTGFAGTGSNTFTGNQTIQNTAPTLFLTDTNANSDYSLVVNSGEFRIKDETNSANRFYIQADGTSTFTGNLNVSSGVDVTGNITVTGNVDGRDVSADGTKLDGISSSAIANVVQDTTPQLGGVLDSNGNNIKMLDSNIVYFGTGNDSAIFHDGTDLKIQNATGQIRIQGAPNEDSVVAIANGATELYYDNTKRFETTGTGVEITGNLQFDSSVSGGTINLQDSQKIFLGGGNDLKIYHDGSDSYIDDVGTGNLYITSTDGNINLQTNGSENAVKCIENGAVELYHDGTKKLETTSGGATITGEGRLTSHLVMNTADNQTIYLGAANDLTIKHDGSNSIIDNNTNDLILRSDGDDVKILAEDDIVLRDNDDSTNFIHCVNGGAVDLYHNGTKKFSTTANGIELPGTNSLFLGGKIDMPDNDSGSNGKILLGTGDDLGLYHTGSNGYVVNTTGDLILTAGATSSTVLRSKFDSTVFNNAANNQNQLVLDGGIAKLYASGAEKFRTTSAGILVTGNITAGDNQQLQLGANGDLRLYHDGSSSYVRNTLANNTLFLQSAGNVVIENTNGSNYFKGEPSGAATLYHNGSSKLATTSGGATVTGTLTATSFSGDGSNLTGVSGAEIYGFNKDANGTLIVTTTNGGADNISGTTFDAFEDVVFAATGFSFSVNANGKLIATI